MRYEENVDDLPRKLAEFAPILQTEVVSKNQVRYRLQGGLVVNLNIKQKNVYVQGRNALVRRLEAFLQPKPDDAAKVANIVGSSSSGEKSYSYKRHQEEPSIIEYSPNRDSELIIALVAAVGTDLSFITGVITERLKTLRYETTEIKISNDIIAAFKKIPELPYFARVDALMSEGNNIRKETGDNSILAKIAAAKINEMRAKTDKTELLPIPRRAFIVSSLKHPEEVAALRTIYSNGFFLIGVHASSENRNDYLRRDKNVPQAQVDALIKRDVDEAEKHGQHTRDTYHLSDFFVNFGADRLKFKNDVWRHIDLIFGKPFVTPTFDEFAMFMAFSASLRSADLSRQVGAVITRDHAIVSTGANDVPKYGGGLYWPDYHGGNEIHDVKDGRDHVRTGDTNVIEKNDIIADILAKVDVEDQPALKEILANSKIKNITEYGRVVHAEMEALLSCARGHIATAGAHLYCTTFPCHNCAKHIIAAGITKVIYVEPYPKSKALDFHGDSITLSGEKEKVSFRPFVGVGPRSFFNLFSVNLGSGYEISRKGKDGKPIQWQESDARLRMQMLPTSYIERESITTSMIHKLLEKLS